MAPANNIVSNQDLSVPEVMQAWVLGGPDELIKTTKPVPKSFDLWSRSQRQRLGRGMVCSSAANTKVGRKKKQPKPSECSDPRTQDNV